MFPRPASCGPFASAAGRRPALFERARLPITGAGTDPAAVAGIGGERRCRALGSTWHPCC
ncbi:hypothetical protein HMPREF3150_00732 [Pseudomonas aeruginosa]|nr:hypothetical protein HMPREF3150_00732 [Pseudomonas aeruginosa]